MALSRHFGPRSRGIVFGKSLTVRRRIVALTRIDSTRFEAHGWRMGWRRLQSALTVLKIRGAGNAEPHDLHEILIRALYSLLCGGQTAMGPFFARAKEGFLRGFLTLQKRLPSQDRFSRLFRRLDPDQFRTWRLSGILCGAYCDQLAKNLSSKRIAN
jgi:hypothetical protein